MLLEALVRIAASVIAAIGSDIFGLEALLVLAAFFLLRSTSALDARFAHLEKLGSTLSARPWLAVAACGVLPILLRLLLLPLVPIPHPVVPDEFSHLLLADTLVHGRLANPPHPLWQSFETLHILVQPTHSSVYFPGPALFLALGQLLFHWPYAGVLLSIGMLCAAICWALQGWFPSRWALLGALLAILKFGLLSQWMNSYWGGQAAALGGTLLLGTIPRLYRHQTFRIAGVFACGAALLVLTRPYESVGVLLPFSVRLIAWMRGLSRTELIRTFMRFVPTVAIGLAITAVGVLYYFSRVTLQWGKLPYEISRRMYGWPMTLPWSEVIWVYHPHRELRNYFLYEIYERVGYTGFANFISSALLKAQADWRFYLGPALSTPIIALWRGKRWDKPVRLFALVILAQLAFVSIMPHFPHYMAPATIAVVGLTVQGIRHLRLWRTPDGEPVGLRLSRAIPVILALVLVVRALAGALGLPYQYQAGFASWCCSDPGFVDQTLAERTLPRAGKHLIIVRYGPSHGLTQEFVYNQAIIDDARIVWAHERDYDQNRRLLEYFKDRQPWLLEPDRNRSKLTPYVLDHRPKNPLEYDHFK